MFKGLIALFTSGVIFQPMVLIGVLIGIIVRIRIDIKDISSFYINFNFLIFAIVISLIYNFFFNKVMKNNGNKYDTSAMGYNIITSAIKLTFSSIIAVLFTQFFFY